ncbi:sterile alpha motif domain-containing 3-like isoform X2 [Labeo rohita]|uniref:Sterile alpha motif domain-containing 3-like isoform X2 n=1 Tax=Labeo rohita TaxID=84645 RepID=A0A498NKH0_LABRO|nr:sterile alpha motif domain-containing 3-like isoform X2 [Labeo rohita]
MIEHTMYPTNAEYVQVAKALIVKYPFLKDLEGNGYHTWHQSLKRKFKTERSPLVHDDELCDEVDRMHSSAVSLSQRFKEGFTSIVPKVLELQRNAPLAKIYKEAREEMLAEDLPVLILLPHIFKEKAESLVTLGECDADNPYPTIQLVETDWKMAFSKRVQVLVKADGVEVCRGIGVEEGILAAFSAYYVFNLAYPPYMKNTLTFLQHAIAKITEVVRAHPLDRTKVPMAVKEEMPKEGREVRLEVYVNGAFYSADSYWASDEKDVQLEFEITDAIYDFIGCDASREIDVQLEVETDDHVSVSYCSPGDVKVQLEVDGNENISVCEVEDLQLEMDKNDSIPELKCFALVAEEQSDQSGLDAVKNNSQTGKDMHMSYSCLFMWLEMFPGVVFQE